MNNQGKKEKITDLYSSSVYFVPRTLDDEMIDKLSKTAIKLVLKLNRYFSTETGRKVQRNTYKMSELLKELGSNKPISSKCFFDIINQIKESKLFLMYEDLNTKDKEFTFFLPNEFNESIFKDVELQKKYFKNKSFTHVLENNIKKFSSKKEKSSSENENSSSNNWNSSSVFENSSSKTEKSSSVFEAPETIVNTDKIDIVESCQDYYIKDNYIKETYINIENDTHDFLNDEVKGTKENTNVEKIDTTFKDDSELDKLKGILISDYNFYDNVAEKTLRDYSTKCIRESIDILISKIDNGLEIDYKKQGSYLRGIIKNWKEKKESIQETVSLTQNKKVSQPGEKDFIDFCFSKKINYHISQNNLNASIQNILEREIENKNVFIALKESFSKEQLSDFISSFKNKDVYAYKYTEKIALFWQFWNDLNEMDKYIEKRKIEREQARLYAIELGQNRNKKETVQDTLVNEKILQDLQDDLDSEDIPY